MCFASLLHRCLIKFVSIVMYIASLLHPCLIDVVLFVDQWCINFDVLCIPFASLFDQICIDCDVHCIPFASIVDRCCIICWSMVYPFSCAYPFFHPGSINCIPILHPHCIYNAPHCVWIASGPCKPDFANAADPILQRHFACKSVSAKGFPKQASPRFENRFWNWFSHPLLYHSVHFITHQSFAFY